MAASSVWLYTQMTTPKSWNCCMNNQNHTDCSHEGLKSYLPFKLRLERDKTHPTHQPRRPSVWTRFKFQKCWNLSGILTLDTAFENLFPPVPGKSVLFKSGLFPFRLASRSHHVLRIMWSKSTLRRNRC